MSLDHILLGLLREPQSGYRLKQTFDTIFSHFWAAEISQIYRQLKALEKRGLLDSRAEPSQKGPPRRIYETTTDGLDELHSWLAAGPQFADRRVPYLAQTLFLDQLSSQERLAFFRQLRDEMQIRMRLMLDIDAELRFEHEDAGDVDEAEQLGQLILNHGLYRWNALLTWCEDSLALLEEGKPNLDLLHRAGAVAQMTLTAEPDHTMRSNTKEKPS